MFLIIYYINDQEIVQDVAKLISAIKDTPYFPDICSSLNCTENIFHVSIHGLVF